VFDFFKERDEDMEDEGGHTEQIDLENIGKSHGAKKNKLTLNYFAIAFGATIEIEYDVTEEGLGFTRHSIALESGDAFICNSLVKSISYTVKRTTNRYHQ